LQLLPFVDGSDFRKVSALILEKTADKPSLLSSFVFGGMAFGSYNKDGPQETFLALFGRSRAFLEVDQTPAGPLKTLAVYFTVGASLFSAHGLLDPELCNYLSRS